MKFAGCDLASAIKMSSTNVAHLYGLNDRGEIKPGLRADLILFTLDDCKVNIKKTIVEGIVVFESPD
jgi:alpha-D-ribose 1-methylphosphonate 5-triphosphate diphosphatase PhnM